jgi:hypothetical protein
MYKIIEVTLNGVLHYVVDHLADPVIYTTDPANAQLYAEDKVDGVIADISLIDSEFSSGNPHSTPPSPF